jgi:hypothetical protein
MIQATPMPDIDALLRTPQFRGPAASGPAMADIGRLEMGPSSAPPPAAASALHPLAGLLAESGQQPCRKRLSASAVTVRET